MRFVHSLLLMILCSLPVAAQSPNVIYILADDLGYGDLSCYGQTRFDTPNIDRLANEGLKFTAHYSGNTVCSPSRAVLMTGRHSGHVYLRGNLSGERGAELDPALTTLPEIFKAAGYRTGMFGKWGLGNTHLDGPANPLMHGFDEFCGWKSQTIAHTYYPTTMVRNGEEVPLAEGTFIHDLVMEEAREFIRTCSETEHPFFCYIPTAVPHAAMHAPAELHRKWRLRLPEFDGRIGRYGAGGEPCPDVINPIAGFAAMMENLDNEVGCILQLLQQLGIDDSTLILFASDNGAHKEGGHDPTYWNSTGGLRGHKRDMHEGGIRTPLLVRWPGVTAPGEVTAHISGFQDVLPTMAALVGQAVPAEVDGISFLPTIRGDRDGQQKHDFLYFEFCKGVRQQIDSQAVRRGPWKAFRRRGKPTELFRLDKDPFERNDVSGEYPDVISEMQRIMEEAHRPLPGAAEN